MSRTSHGYASGTAAGDGTMPLPAGGRVAALRRRLTIGRVRRAGWALMMLAVLVVAVLNSRFIWIPIREIMHRAVDHLGRDDFQLYFHLWTAPAIVVIGGIGFMPFLRERWPAVHRWGGRVYLTAVLLTAPATFTLALHETEGPLTVFGFATLSLLWFVTAAIAWWHAYNGRHQIHGEWMVRNYALTLTNVTFRAELHFALLCGAPFTAVYEPIRVLQFIPNLLIAELLIRSGALTSASWSEWRMRLRRLAHRAQ